MGLVLVAAIAGCGSSGGGPQNTSPPATDPTPSPTIQPISEFPDFGPLEPEDYFVAPGDDPSPRVVFTVPADGWSEWIGATKFAGDGHVAVSIATVTNLVRHACDDHSRPDPPGPTVDDLASALADLAPFRVTSPPTDITIYGYRGQHLELTVPDLPVEGRGDDRRFTGCIEGKLKSWIAPPYGAFYGYTGPGYTEEFWILDVDGSRVVIAAERSPDSPAKDLAELRAMLDSIRIEL